MRRLILATLSTTVCCGAASVAAHSITLPSTLCVGKKPGCYATIQAAVDAAHDGDTIKVGPGTYAGGISIGKSVRLAGAGAAATIIKGGGPVITIGSGGSNPTVSIRGVTVTGGANDSSPGPSFVAGGGVQIATGARVAIDDSSISGNAAAPQTPFPEPAQACGDVPYDQCAFADGGGIDNSGTLVVSDSVVSDNVAGSIPGLAMVASNASGGGIESHSPGSLTLRNSTVTDNQAVVGLPNGRFTDGGGMTIGGGLKIVDSVVSGNSSDVTASLSSTFPFEVEQEANAGGIDLTEGSNATITTSTIDDNTVTASNTGGDANAQAGGSMQTARFCSTEALSVETRSVRTVPTDSGTAALAIEGGLQVMGDVTMRDSRVAHNKVTAVSPGGRLSRPAEASTTWGRPRSSECSWTATPLLQSARAASLTEAASPTSRSTPSIRPCWSSATASSPTT